MFRQDRLHDGHKKKRGSELIGIIRFIHSVFFWLLVFFYSLIVHVAFYITALFIRGEDAKDRFYQNGARLWGAVIANASLMKIEVSGLENIPVDTNVIFTPNHQSYLDIFVLLKYLPQPFRFIVMRDLFKVPVIGYYMTRAGFLSLDRKDRKNSIKTIHRIIDLLGKGESFVIFPEGKLTVDGGIGEFGRGASIIIQRSRKPVVPILIEGTFKALPKGAWILSGSRVRVRIGRLVYFDRYCDDVNKSASMELGVRLKGIVAGLSAGN